MVNAAKSDGRIDRREKQRILGKLREMGVDPDSREFVRTEMNQPMNTESIVLTTTGRPELAASLYAASLLAIEVSTAAEKDNMGKFAAKLGLDRVVVEHLEKAVGLR
jgi:uncharacterized membrane protein YebE (DUF533 family)